MNTQEDDSLLYRSGQNRGRLLWFVGIGLFIAWNLLLFILAVVAIAKVVRVTSHVKRKIFCLLIVFLFRTTKALLLAQVTHMLQFLGPLKLDGTSRLARRGLSPFCPMALCELVPAQLYFHSAVRYHKYR